MRYNYPRFRARLKDTNEFVFWNDYGEITKSNGTPSRFPISREPGATNYYYYVHQIRNKITLPSLCTYFEDVNGRVIYTNDKLEIAEVGTYTVVWNQDELAYQLADDEGKIQLSLLAVIYTVGPKAITLVEADPLKPAKSSSSSEVDN